MLGEGHLGGESGSEEEVGLSADSAHRFSARSRNTTHHLMRERLERHHNRTAVAHLEADKGHGLESRRRVGGPKHINGSESFNLEPLEEGERRRNRANEVIPSLCWRGNKS